MYKLVKCEFYKLKSMISIPILFLFPLIAVITGFINIHNGKLKISTVDQMWNAIYMQNSSLYAGILFPVFLCALISLQWRVEFKNNNINNLLITHMPCWKVYLSKILASFIVASINILIYIIILFTATKVFLPRETVKSFIFYGPIIGLICSLPLICIQHFLSMNFKNFALPLTIGIFLSFPNFIISCYSFSNFLPYSYVCKGMFFNVSNPFNIECQGYIFAFTSILFIVGTFIGTHVLKNRDFR